MRLPAPWRAPSLSQKGLVICLVDKLALRVDMVDNLSG